MNCCLYPITFTYGSRHCPLWSEPFNSSKAAFLSEQRRNSAFKARYGRKVSMTGESGAGRNIPHFACTFIGIQCKGVWSRSLKSIRIVRQGLDWRWMQSRSAKAVGTDRLNRSGKPLRHPKAKEDHRLNTIYRC